MKGALLILDDSKAWSPIDFGDMFESHLLSSTIVWDKLKVAAGEYSITEETFDIYDCFVLTGSRFNCRDRETLSWFEPLCQLIRTIEINASKRLYGGCFGCQIVAHALGGVVDRNPGERFALLAEEVFLHPEARADVEARGDLVLPTGHSVKVIVSHGDCVRILPQNSIRFASSASCENEGYLCGRFRNLLCLQSHPEFDKEYCIEQRIWKAVVETNKRLNEEEVSKSRASFDAFGGRLEGPDQLMAMIKRFLLKE